MAKLKSIFLIGTLKASPEVSNTLILSEFLAKHLETYDTVSQIVRLADYNIKPGVYTHLDVNSDDWPVIFEKILAADIIIFATPVWWGIQSSLIQRAIERLDEIYDEIMESGRSKLTNKVAGIVVSGDSDGAEHIIGNLANFFAALGLTFPPFGSLTVLWPGFAKKSNKTKEEAWKYIEDTYTSTAKRRPKTLHLWLTCSRIIHIPNGCRIFSLSVKPQLQFFSMLINALLRILEVYAQVMIYFIENFQKVESK